MISAPKNELLGVEMKAFAASLLAVLAVSIVVSSAFAHTELQVGVEEGDWIEYNIDVTGAGALPPTHDVRWMRMDVLQVQDTAFSTNFTVRYANGTLGSAVWQFNFSEGNTEGWLIIPSNLGLGDTFYDSSMHTGEPVYVAIEGEEERTVLGATRTVTYASDSLRHKEWDKATGVFVGSSEHLKNITNKSGWYIEDLTVSIKPTATNMWSPEVILGLDQTGLVGVIVVSAVLALSLVVVARRREVKR
jgi:hypothetical protein